MLVARIARSSCAVAVGLAAMLASLQPTAAGPALDRVRAEGLLVAAADPSWPPFSWRDPVGELYGFDVDVTREIADRMGARAEFVAPGWEEQIAGAWEGRWDIVVNNVTPTPERAERLVFPAIYAYGAAVVAVRADDAEILSLPDLDGAAIGVVEDTLYESYLAGADMGIDGQPAPDARIRQAEIVTFADSAAPYRLLDEDRVIDAVIDDVVAVQEQIARGRPIRIVGEPLFTAPSAVAIDQGDPEFAAAIARIVTEMREDGTLAELSERWFDTPSHATAVALGQ